MRTALEAVLQEMMATGWANASDGDVNSPTGAFARVTNEESEVTGWPGGVEQAFNEVIVAYECDVKELVGHFLVREDAQGNVSVTRYDNPIALTRDFQQLQDDYALWLESE